MSSPSLLHNFQRVSNGELGVCLLLHLFNLHTRRQFSQGELAGGPVHLEYTL